MSEISLGVRLSCSETADSQVENAILRRVANASEGACSGHATCSATCFIANLLSDDSACVYLRFRIHHGLP